jgi:UrcA family protein
LIRLSASPGFSFETFLFHGVRETAQRAGAYQPGELRNGGCHMNTQSVRSDRLGGRHAVCAAALLTALLGIVPMNTLADQPAATKTVSVTDVSLADLNLSTSEGMRLAAARLRTMAEHICAAAGGDPSSRRAFGACVDGTVASALQHIDAVRQHHLTVHNTVTVGASVSLADLDLSTLEGADTARQRLDALARRLCGELAKRRDLLYPPSYASCVHETFARALAQADIVVAARNTPTASRSTH